MYQKVVKPILFKFDPEFVHDRMTTMGRIMGSNPVTRGAISAAYRYEHPILEQDVLGVHFKNPIGLSAGFDKNCQLMKVMPAVGFGFEEVGSITAQPYEGNPKPRLVRLPKDQSIIVYYGLKNIGAKELRKRFIDKRGRQIRYAIPIGISVAKTNIEFSSLKAKLDDWVTGVKLMKDCGQYMTINVSCPNTFDPLNFNDPKLLDALLKRVSAVDLRKPVFLKLSADIPTAQLDAIVTVCDKYQRKTALNSSRALINGFILTNLVKDRKSVKLKSKKSEYEQYKGGMSGKLVAPKALNLTKYCYENYGDRYVIVSVGGIFNADDAYERIRNGATLLQLITGMIYGGPATIGKINKGLAKKLQEDGFSNIAEAIGVDCKAKWER
jgi:dihydroorotate dehydrogenase